MAYPGAEQDTKALVIDPVIQERFDEILQQRRHPLTEKQVAGLQRAFRFAYKAHHSQTRLTGEPYISHPLEVMGILSELNVDTVTLTGALLHDVIEDTGISLEEVAREFGPVVALLVEGMTKLSSLTYDTRSNEERQAEYFRKMLLSMAQDLRVILIKLADRLHNMRTIDVMPMRSQKRNAQETLDIYAPLAHRFGIGRIRWELEDHALKVLDPVAYRRIAERVAMKLEEREKALDSVLAPVRERLEQQGVQAEVYGRAKHFYSIYNKIRRRGKSFEEILDLLAVRIVVDTIPQCYQALGIIHNLFTPIIERFSDYIAMPKGNGYQSLHTKVISPQGHTVEVQIRTRDMNLVAEVGIAAHWHYKEAAPQKAEAGVINTQSHLSDYYKWLKQLIEGSKEESDSEEFMRNLKINLFTDEIYVFTPRGKLIQLPKQACPIDFAFAVHSDIGLHTLGAKINGKMAPLTQPLNNGDSVEILTSSNAAPNVEWLRHIRTTRARAQIKRHIKQTQMEESIRIGQELFERALSEQHVKLKREELAELFSDLGYDSADLLFAAIGSGELTTAKIINRLGGKIDQKRLQKEKKKKGQPGEGAASSVRVKGGEQYIFTYANCCNPLPGDRIIGAPTKGGGIQVHQVECPAIADLLKGRDGRLVEVEWDVEDGAVFKTRLRLFAEDRVNLMRDITAILSKHNINILEAHMRVEGTLVIGTMLINVSGQAHLQKLLNRLSKIKNVVQVERVHVAEVA